MRARESTTSNKFDDRPPHATSPPDAIHYTTSATLTGTVITTDAGSLTVEDGVFKIKGPDGTVVAGSDLSFRVDDFVFPIDVQINYRTATLTPRFDLAHASYRPVSLPYEEQALWKTQYDREQAAWSRLVTTITAGATIGTMVGGLGGAAVGFVIGGIAGATVAAATIVGMFGPFIPAAAIGCLGGIMAVGALGTAAGQLLVTVPVAIMAAIQYFTTVNSPRPAPPRPSSRRPCRDVRTRRSLRSDHRELSARPAHRNPKSQPHNDTDQHRSPAGGSCRISKRARLLTIRSCYRTSSARFRYWPADRHPCRHCRRTKHRPTDGKPSPAIRSVASIGF